jgi:hypothetical protein
MLKEDNPNYALKMKEIALQTQ